MTRRSFGAAFATLTAVGSMAIATAPAHAAALPDVQNLADLSHSVSLAPAVTAAQTFTTNVTAPAASLTLPLGAATAATLNVALDSVNPTTGFPLTATPLATATVGVPATSQPVFTTVPLSGVVLSAGHSYAIVVSGSSSTVSWAANTATAFPALATATSGIGVQWVADPLLRGGFAVEQQVPDSQGSSSVTGTLIAGSLGLRSVPSAVSIPPVQLNGLDQQTSSFSLPIDVNDATGSGAGWSVALQATQFTNQRGFTLPSDALHAVGAAGVSCDPSASGCTAATASDSTSARQVVTAGVPTQIFSAAAETGMGAQTVSPQFTVQVPAGAHAGTYASTWTVTLSTGP